jgi:hypothetical protein
VSHEFDPGYGQQPFTQLVQDYPGTDVYPQDSFRTEWGHATAAQTGSGLVRERRQVGLFDGRGRDGLAQYP